ncbi:SDR family NAD(P)-dependent oxidoreductase [Celeribacter sp.]|uniref:SDR family NAD(P)-dependent oxidoreductase n=1 Tax=Celeribacter sp. TaxID=1890673 RepID=UPI003A8CC3EA
MTKIAILTGGSTGIGAHLVGALVAAGYRVGFSYNSSEAPARAVEALYDGAAFAVKCDAGDEVQVPAFHAAVADHFGGAPDLLVNNAGIQTWASLLDLKVADFDKVIRTNLRGAFLNTQEAARAMKAAGKGGAIINIGSGCNKVAFPKLVDYAASKGGIEQFTKTAASELGPLGIRVNCVAPGAIANERTAEEAEGYADKWAALTPLRRVGLAADIAGPVVFLASDAASFVTGQTLYVDGGVFACAPWPDYGG